MNEPFERQTNPVTITISGDELDVDYWIRKLMRGAEFNGDLAQRLSQNVFKIYPRAVND